MSDQHDWMAGMTDFQRAEVARLESRIVSFEKRWESLEADWNDCKKALAAAKAELVSKADELAAMRQQRDEARICLCELYAAMGGVYRRSNRAIEFKTPEEIAEVFGWDCFKEGGGA